MSRGLALVEKGAGNAGQLLDLGARAGSHPGLCVVCVAVFAMEQLSTANTAFALDIFRLLCNDNHTGNIFISPYSISSAMGMLFLGTRGETAAQLSKVNRSGPSFPAPR